MKPAGFSARQPSAKAAGHSSGVITTSLSVRRSWPPKGLLVRHFQGRTLCVREIRLFDGVNDRPVSTDRAAHVSRLGAEANCLHRSAFDPHGSEEVATLTA